MRPRTSHKLPGLEIRSDGVAFVYPKLWENPNERWHELLMAIPAVMILAGLGVFFLALAALVPEERTLHERWPLFGLGGGFLLLGPLAAFWTWHRFHYHEWYLQKARDRQLVELAVENLRLIRRYASGRTEVWPREQIENVVVEHRRERISTGENDQIIIISYLCLRLRAGGKVDLAGPTIPEEHLHRMAQELRETLQVPYDAPPTPIAGASVERSAEGDTIRLPSVAAEAVWRNDVRTYLWAAGMLGGFLAICWAIFHSRTTFLAEVGSKLWLDSLFVLVCSLIIAAIFCSIAIAQYFNKSEGVRAIADRTLVALAVRSGALYRCYQSGREESWSGSDIATVQVDQVKKSFQVRLHLKGGSAIHLFGNVAVDERNKLLREGLTWLALQLCLGLGLATGDPAPTHQTEAPPSSG